MRALILGSSSAGPLKEMLDRRHSWGADRHDEVWRGVLHLDLLRTHADLAQQLGELLSPQARAAGMTVAMGECNFGEAEHDGHELDGALRLTSAQLVVEIVTPDQDSWEKLSFYAVHHINEVVIVDPAERVVHWLMLAEPGGYQAVERSGLIDLDPFKLADDQLAGVVVGEVAELGGLGTILLGDLQDVALGIVASVVPVEEVAVFDVENAVDRCSR